MSYNDAELQALYEEWLQKLSEDGESGKLTEMSQVMRSKLTTIIASAQLLVSDLKEIGDKGSEQSTMAREIVEAARQISVLLDAAVDIEHEQNSETNPDMLD